MWTIYYVSPRRKANQYQGLRCISFTSLQRFIWKELIHVLCQWHVFIALFLNTNVHAQRHIIVDRAFVVAKDASCHNIHDKLSVWKLYNYEKHFFNANSMLLTTCFSCLKFWSSQLQYIHPCNLFWQNEQWWVKEGRSWVLRTVTVSFILIHETTNANINRHYSYITLSGLLSLTGELQLYVNRIKISSCRSFVVFLHLRITNFQGVYTYNNCKLI